MRTNPTRRVAQNENGHNAGKAAGPQGPTSVWPVSVSLRPWCILASWPEQSFSNPLIRETPNLLICRRMVYELRVLLGRTKMVE